MPPSSPPLDLNFQIASSDVAPIGKNSTEFFAELELEDGDLIINTGYPNPFVSISGGNPTPASRRIAANHGKTILDQYPGNSRFLAWMIAPVVKAEESVRAGLQSIVNNTRLLSTHPDFDQKTAFIDTTALPTAMQDALLMKTTPPEFEGEHNFWALTGLAREYENSKLHAYTVIVRKNGDVSVHGASLQKYVGTGGAYTQSVQMLPLSLSQDSPHAAAFRSVRDAVHGVSIPHNMKIETRAEFVKRLEEATMSHPLREQPVPAA